MARGLRSLVHSPIRSSGVGRGGGGGGPSFLTLPWARNFEADTNGQLPADFTEGALYGGWTQDQGLVEVQNDHSGLSGGSPHNKNLYVYSNPSDNHAGQGIVDLGGVIDCSAGIRIAWYGCHLDNHMHTYGPVLTKDLVSSGGDYLRIIHEWANDVCKLQQAVDGSNILNITSGSYPPQGSHGWHVHNHEINFAAGTGFVKSYDLPTSWDLNGACTFSFTPKEGPTNLRYLALSNWGSTSTWDVYDQLWYGSVWIGGLTDAWPTRGQIWSV